MKTSTETIKTICSKSLDIHARVRMMDRLKLKKADVKAACVELGLNPSGTRSTLCYRLARTL